MADQKDKKAPKPKDYSIDEILAEAKIRLDARPAARRPAQPAPEPEKPAQEPPLPEITEPSAPAPQEIPAQPATPARSGEIRLDGEGGAQTEREKRGRGGFFARRQQRRLEKECCFNEEEDIYYGLQLKSIDEYKKGYDDAEPEPMPGPTATYADLFDESPESDMEEELSARFGAPRRERSGSVLREVPPAREFQKGAADDRRKTASAREPANPTPAFRADPRVGGRTLEFKMPPPRQAENPIRLEVRAPRTARRDEADPLVDLEKAAREIEAARTGEEKAEPGFPVEKREELLEQDVPKTVLAVEKFLTPEQDKVSGAEKFLPPEQAKIPISEKASPPEREKIPVAEKRSPLEQERIPVTEILSTPEREKIPIEEQLSPPEQEEISAAKSTGPERAEEETPQAGDAVPEDAEALKKQKIRELIDSAPKYPPREENVHVVGMDQLAAAFDYEARAYAGPPVQQQESGLDSEAPLKPDRKKRKKSGGLHTFRFLGETEEDNDPNEELPREPEELDDYTAPEDAPSVAHELGRSTRALALRMLVSGLITVLLLGWGLLCERSGMLPQALQVEVNPLAYLTVNFCFVVIAAAFCWMTIWSGLKALATLQANSDSAVAVATLAVLVQGAAAFFAQDAVMGAQIHLYPVLAVGGLFLNSAGKLSMVRRIGCNFRYIASPGQKLGVELFDDYNTALQLAKGCVADAPVIAYQRKTGFFKHFLRNSYEPDPAEQASRMLAPVTFVGSLLLCITSLVLTRDFAHALTAFTAAACISVPAVNMLCVNLPLSRLCALARRCGVMLVGYPSVEYFCNTNAVMIDAKDLFPKGTVILNGLKTFGGQRIDEAIVDATALVCEVGGPLSDLFDQIIKNRREMLPKAENVSYEDERGVLGWVAGRRTLVGSRELMEAHSIEPPSHDYEEKYLLGGKKVIYLASGGELVAMFIVSYNSDKRRALELRRMEENGISLIVRTCDPNMTPEFLAQCFGLDAHSVRVLPERLGSLYQELSQGTTERADALFATKGRPASMLRMLTACVREKSNVTLAVALQNVAVVLGFALVAFLVCYSGLRQLTTAALLLYELFWILAVLLLPRLRRP